MFRIALIAFVVGIFSCGSSMQAPTVKLERDVVLNRQNGVWHLKAPVKVTLFNETAESLTEVRVREVSVTGFLPKPVIASMKAPPSLIEVPLTENQLNRGQLKLELTVAVSVWNGSLDSTMGMSQQSYDFEVE